MSAEEGALTGYSAVLGLDFHVHDRALRMFDPITQTWLRFFREEIAARRIVEERAEFAEEREAQLERILREHGIAPSEGRCPLRA